MSAFTSHPDMPAWTPPTTTPKLPELNVLNSLTRTKVPFLPMEDGSNAVRWYMCGPTVYDASHMGHARTYLGFDIIKRIMESYFGYDLTLVMNITDIDDKIIKRSAERDIPFTELARHWEEEFMKDMDLLGVEKPKVVTRVSEFMPEITAYIQRIIDKGFAYEANGSVYFSVRDFDADDMHCYCKLLPTGKGNQELLAEGEGVLSGAADFINEKKSPNDFALWKKAKEGEPSWDSPFGKGRPGWHIECSVMASNVFQSLGIQTGKMDIHSGGVDLKFPHHDNEMAQAEAEAGEPQWVNYFLHAGHLHIKGFKMSKSLKNFITIRQALEQNTGRQIRLCFLLHKYNEPMDYGDDTMAHACDMETMFKSFFLNVKAALRSSADETRWQDVEAKLARDLEACKKAVHDALCDDFDTPQVFKALQGLVNAVNAYLKEKEACGAKPVELVVRESGRYVTRMFKTFGLIPSGAEIGFPVDAEGGGANKEEVLSPVLDAILKFRADVRDAAKSQGGPDVKALLSLCDALRDDVMPNLGITLEDKGEGAGVWKLENPEDIQRAKERKQAEAERKRLEKEARDKEAAEKEKANSVPPLEFMKALTLDDGSKKYAKFGGDGMPTHDGKGEELNKSQLKKAKKEFEGQKKKYEKVMAKK
mmetsp:Transcript_2672/g.5565  ORF Transcript_2672/g.5565 Transcript_2672/m.5565 type:complete len:648 (-) Transcript_2672:41-1984(-)